MAGDFLGLLGSKNYSEIGNLMRSGHLGEIGYIASRAIEGFTKARQISKQANTKVNLILIRLAMKAENHNKNFKREVLVMEKDRAKIISGVMANLKPHFDRANKLLLKCIDIKNIEKLEEMSKFANNFLESIQDAQALIVLISERNSVDPKFTTACIKASEETFQCVIDTIKETCEMNEDALNKLIDVNMGEFRSKLKEKSTISVRNRKDLSNYGVATNSAGMFSCQKSTATTNQLAKLSSNGTEHIVSRLGN